MKINTKIVMFPVAMKIKHRRKISFQNKTLRTIIKRTFFGSGKNKINVFDVLLRFHGDNFVIGFTTVHSGVLVVGSVTVVELVDVTVVALVVMR